MDALPKPSSLTKKLMEEGPFAFPFEHRDALCPGMTLRDYFAGKVMAGLISGAPDGVYAAEVRAHLAYKQADAMLVERAK